MNQVKQFEFKYKGENFIDLNTLITSQFHFLAAVNEIQKELYPEVDLRLRVGAFSEGSFIVDLLMESSWTDHLFNRDNVELLLGVVGGFAGLVKIHQYLKGKKASKVEESGDQITISVDGENNTVVVDKRVYNLYKNNPSVNKAIQQNFELLDADHEIDGVVISEKDAKEESEPILDVKRESFKDLAAENPYLNRDTLEELHKNENLFIKKPNLMPEKNKVWKWDFVHKGRDITAKITDWQFAVRINDGLRIGQGDRMLADLKIHYKFNKTFNTFVESGKYEIVRVYSITQRPEQSSFDVD